MKEAYMHSYICVLTILLKNASAELMCLHEVCSILIVGVEGSLPEGKTLQQLLKLRILHNAIFASLHHVS